MFKVAHGVTRFVILTNRYAIKIPQLKFGWEFFLRGLLANMQEVEFSRMNDGRMCPIKFHLPGGWLIIMPRCNEISSDEFINLDPNRFYPNKNEDYHPDNLCDSVRFNVPVEYKQNSFGIYNGEVVAIDYGS